MKKVDGYQIRRMEKRDAGKTAKLEASNFAQPWREEDFAKAADQEGVLYLIAEADGKIIGCCGVQNLCGDGEITNVSVDAAYRGAHIAECLMRELMIQGKDLGIESYTLEVRSGNQLAIGLYEKLGFVTEGLRPGFYDHPKEDALIMWKR